MSFFRLILGTFQPCACEDFLYPLSQPKMKAPTTTIVAVMIKSIMGVGLRHPLHASGDRDLYSKL